MRTMESSSRFLVSMSLSVLLGACASTGPAPVEDLNGGSSRVVARETPTRGTTSARSYQVQRGDTLYSIAFRHGLDFREIAAWNRIGAPYTIYVGQTLRLESPSAAPASRTTAAATTRPSTTAKPGASTAAPSNAPREPAPAPFEPLENTPPPAPATNGAPVAGSATTAAPKPPANVATATPPSTPVPANPAPPVPAAPTTPPADAVATVGEVGWRWPADGTLVGAFVSGDQTKQGIDISGKSGDPVRAAADGTVVYSGNGLVGYGELVIIKHNASYLSAYGHNRKRMVKEGDRVKAGQVIAEMGSSSASRDSLHFEIRKNGKPANPLDYLPRR